MKKEELNFLNEAFEKRGAYLEPLDSGLLLLNFEPEEYVTYDTQYEFGSDESKDIHSFANALRELAENFDADEEASLWVGPDGHGTNGAPYRLRDILREFDLVKAEYEKLAEIATVVEADFRDFSDRRQRLQKKLSAEKLAALQAFFDEGRRFRFSDTPIGNKLRHLIGGQTESFRTEGKQVYAVLTDLSETHYVWLGKSTSVTEADLANLMESDEGADPSEVVLGYFADEGEANVDEIMDLLQELVSALDFLERDINASTLEGILGYRVD